MALNRSELKRALKHLQENDWHAAHEIVQNDEASPLACWAHGIVHLMEGDLPNARYWYRQAKRTFAGTPQAKSEIESLRRALDEED
jgi:hypothetical protein